MLWGDVCFGFAHGTDLGLSLEAQPRHINGRLENKWVVMEYVLVMGLGLPMVTSLGLSWSPGPSFYGDGALGLSWSPDLSSW